MSQNDWRFTLFDTNTFIGGTSGSAKLHVDFSNPLTSSGDWCRYFEAPNTNSRVVMLPIGNSELTNSSGYEYGYAYSLRVWTRSNWNGNYFTMTFKNNNNLNLGWDPSGHPTSIGYNLTVENGGYLYLSCNANNGGGTSDQLDSAYNSYGYFKNITTISNNNWNGIRMDISPVSGAYDKITIYTAIRTAPNTWNEVWTVNIARTKIAAYIPWANNPNGDGANAIGKGYMGLRLQTQYPDYPIAIDQFEVYKEKVS